MKHTKDRVIILNRTDFGEKDRVLVALGHDHGKATLIAKSTRSPKSKLAGSIELFCESDIQYVKGRGAMFTLTGARLHKTYPHITSDIDRTMLAYEFMKLLNKIIEDGHGQEYFGVLSGSLAALDDSATPLELAKAWFYVRALYESGRLPNLKSDYSGKNLEQASGYNYDSDHHCFSVKEGGKYKADDIKLLRVLAGSKRVPEVATSDDSIRRTSFLVEQWMHLEVY